MFDCLARGCADSLIGATHASRNTSAWRRTYRAVEHKAAKAACRNAAEVAAFCAAIQDFANNFGNLQERRHSADYDPHFRITKSEVVADIETAADAIREFTVADKAEKRAFAAIVLFKKRS